MTEQPQNENTTEGPMFDISDGQHEFIVTRNNVLRFISETLAHADKESMIKLYMFNIQVRMATNPFEKYAVSDFHNPHIRDHLLDPASPKSDPKRTLFVAEVVENVMSGMEVSVNMRNLSIKATVASQGFASGEVAPC